MKDLTHYFTTPVKPCETAGASVETTCSTNLTEKQKPIAVDKPIGEKSPPPKKRAKVKPKTIDVENDTLIPCDISDDESDTIIKPNPNDSSRTRESNAFDVLMTTTRRTSSGPSPPKSMQISKSDKVGQSKRKYGSFQDDDAAADKSKKKKAKLFGWDRKTEKTNEDDVVITDVLIGDDEKTGMNKLGIEDRQAVAQVSNSNSSEIPNQLSVSTSNKCISQTPKSKIKWAMKVKLQSYADSDVQSDNEYSSEDDFLFTPKNRAKFRRKSKNFQSNSELLSENLDESSQKDKRKKTHGDSNGQQKKKNIPKTIDLIDTDNDEPKTHSSKLREKRTKSKIHRKGVEVVDFTDSVQNVEPKIDLTVSEAPTNQQKLKKSSKSKKKSFKSKDSAALHCEDVLPMSENESNLANTIEPVIALSPKKLAPLFVKRPKLSSAVVEARRHFLQSGVPDSVKMKVITATAGGDNGILLPMPFPRISHVAQYNSTTERNVAAEFSYKQRDDYTPNVTTSSECFTDTVNSESPNSKMDNGTIEKANVPSVVSEIESYCSDAQNMWQNISSMLNRTPKKVSKRRSKKLKLEKKSNTTVVEEDSEHLNPTWTCKYKPTNLTEVIGNKASVLKLKDWLAGWKFSLNVNQYNSDDDFYSSSSSNSSRIDNNQVAVLTGPHGSGKTATVYAIAEELGYRVLEVNASARRTGKIILTAFQEATKSHRVKKEQSTLSPVKKRRSTERKAVHQKSLILIEDIDLVFEEDEGFVTAMFQLAANTKRPIILTCREACPYLIKMPSPQLLVKFQAATGTRVSAFLELISLAESGYRLPQVCIDILLRNGDLRQSLLQLQYLLLTGPPNVSQLHYDGARSTLWLDLVPLLYKPLGKASKKAKKKSMSVAAQPMNKLVKILNGISLASLLENQNSEMWPVELSPSLSLDEDLNSYTRITDVGVDIADWLHRSLLGSKRTLNQENFQAASLQARKRQARRSVNDALSQAVPLILERRPLSVDYLPLLRTMGRTEEDRAKTSNRKGKRFHSHLNGLISVSEKLLSTANTFLQDKQTTNVSDEL